MKSLTTSGFWRAYHSLPPDIRKQTRKAYQLWLNNPWHGSLYFSQKDDYWAVRVSRGWRALGRPHGDAMVWFWIGPHGEYERLIRGA